MLYCTVKTIGCYETNSDCVLLWCEHTQWLATNHAYVFNAREFYGTPWIPLRKMSRDSHVMNYSWVKLLHLWSHHFYSRHWPAQCSDSVQAVDDVGYSLVLDKHQKKCTVTYWFDLWLRVEGQRKVKCQTTSNGKSKSVNILTLDRHPKLSTVTSLSDLRLRGQRSIALKWCQNPHRLLFHDFVI